MNCEFNHNSYQRNMHKFGRKALPGRFQTSLATDKMKSGLSLSFKFVHFAAQFDRNIAR